MVTRAAQHAPRPKRRRLAVEERRDELVELGLRLFANRPYDEVSTDDIAAEAGISKGLMYHYFPRKRDLYVASLRLASERLLARTEPDPALPKLMRLRQSLEAYLGYVEGFAGSYAALLKGGVGSDPEAAEIVEHSRFVVIRRVLDALSVAEPKPAVRLSLRGWLGFVEAASLDWLAHGTPDREAVLAACAGALAAALELARQADPTVVFDLEG